MAERAPTSGKPVLIHVEIDANSSFPASPEIPCFTGFRTWFGKEGTAWGLRERLLLPQNEETPTNKGSGY